MVQGKWFPLGADIAVPLSVRRRVFNRERDLLDDQAWQVAVYRDETPVGSARLWWAEGSFMLGDVGVLPEERNRGYGDLLVRLLLFKALTHNAGTVRLAAPASVAPFFARYGFQAEPGENGIVPMFIRGEDVRLSHCGGNCADCDHPSPDCAPKAMR